MMNPSDKLIVALDVETWDEAKNLVEKLGTHVTHYKVGSQLFTAYGPEMVRYLTGKGKKVFLDLKFHDIPNTVANAVSSAVAISGKGGLFMLTIHAQGGLEMMASAQKAAVEKAQKLGVRPPITVAITVLTSDKPRKDTSKIVLERAKLAQKAGLDGVVVSSHEAAMIRKKLGKNFVIVTPGIRPKGFEAGDQKRITTPFDAIKNGSDYLVVGRPIVKSIDSVQAAKDTLEEIGDALAE